MLLRHGVIAHSDWRGIFQVTSIRTASSSHRYTKSAKAWRLVPCSWRVATSPNKTWRVYHGRVPLENEDVAIKTARSSNGYTKPAKFWRLEWLGLRSWRRLFEKFDYLKVLIMDYEIREMKK